MTQILGADTPPRIKIGETGNLPKRVDDHERSKHGVSFTVTPLCAVRGDRSDEQGVLRYFAPHLLEGEKETFYAHDEVVDYIRWLRDQYFVWVPDCKQCVGIDSIDQLDIVNADLWIPTAERRKAPPKSPGMFNDFGPLQLPQREVTIDDFYTNSLIINAARTAMGRIDLDPASHAFANQVVKASKFFTIRDDGLSKEWSGRVWVNPPFSDWENWSRKIVGEWNSGRIESMCVLCATRTLTARYFSPIHEECNGVCILRGRIPFWGGRAGGSPDDGHAVFYFGSEFAEFEAAFRGIGNVYSHSPCQGVPA